MPCSGDYWGPLKPSCFGGWAMGPELHTSISAGKTTSTSAYMAGEKVFWCLRSKLVNLVPSKGKACRDLRRNAGIGWTEGPFLLLLLPPAVLHSQSRHWHIWQRSCLFSRKRRRWSPLCTWWQQQQKQNKQQNNLCGKYRHCERIQVNNLFWKLHVGKTGYRHSKFPLCRHLKIT